MKRSSLLKMTVGVAGKAAVILLATSVGAFAYDGLHCKEPGVCWQAQPGYPEKLAGSKYDVRALEDPKEVAKQVNSIRDMEARNAKRVAHFKKSGKWVYEVDKIPE
jgi:methanol dehydrogenase (cytochrome c) subunit 2